MLYMLQLYTLLRGIEFMIYRVYIFREFTRARYLNSMILAFVLCSSDTVHFYYFREYSLEKSTSWPFYIMTRLNQNAK